jgi:ATP-dependent exoDNAse (exonuclease V) beta subunit
MRPFRLSESAHWYTPTAEPFYDILAANGGRRSVTVRDARSLGLVPSVTTVLSILAKPQIEAWKQENAVKSALNMTRSAEETMEDFIDRIALESTMISQRAMNKGTIIHSYIEQKIKRENDIKVNEDIREVCFGIDEYLSRNDFNGCIECARVKTVELPNMDFDTPIIADEILDRKPVVKDFSELSYGGKIDFFGKLNRENYVIDFKTQSTNKDKQVRGYEEWCYQLAAYRFMLKENFKCANVVISTTEPNRIEFIEWPEADLASGLKIFLNALSIFYITKRL